MASSSDSAFSLAETTSTRASGNSSRTWAKNSGPPRPGIRRSLSTTSGRSSRARRRPSSPSAAQPTTWMPGSASSEAVNPSRTRGKSSTTRTRICMGPPLLLMSRLAPLSSAVERRSTSRRQRRAGHFAHLSKRRTRSAIRSARTRSPNDTDCPLSGPSPADGLGVMAAGLIPLDDVARLRVLVVHTNFAVGSAIARRLIDADVVALAHAASVLDGNQDPRRYDVVLLCPYLPTDQRDAILETCLATRDGTVIELLDSHEGSRVLLHRAGVRVPGAADAVAEALALPLAPARP